MKRNYPAKAFALGILLFSAGMKEAFAAGILVIFSVTAAEFIKDLLKDVIPLWSLRLCVLIGAGSLCASAFLLGFTALGIEVGTGTWVMTFILGLLCGWEVLESQTDGAYGDLLYESGILWGFWVLLALIREFVGTGTVFGYLLYEGDFQSKAFLGSTFAFLTAGLVLAFANGILKKEGKDKWEFLVLIPAVIFMRPFSMDRFGAVIGAIWTVAVPLMLFVSVKMTLRFSRQGRAYEGLPIDMLALGFIYMILSMY